MVKRKINKNLMLYNKRFIEVKIMNVCRNRFLFKLCGRILGYSDKNSLYI